MNKTINILLITMLMTSCNTGINTIDNKDEITDKIELKTIIMKDTMPKVTGIGGIFFRSDNPKETSDWYGNNLGLAIDEYGSAFEFRNANRPDEINYLREKRPIIKDISIIDIDDMRNSFLNMGVK